MLSIEVDGRRVAYEAAGADTAAGGVPPLLCLHGFTGSKEDFSEVLGALARDRAVYVPDLPGHGSSDGLGDPDAYGLAALAQRGLAIADALGLDAFHLLGHSLGGLVAQRVASVASHRLEGLVLAGTGVGAPPEQSLERVGAIAVAVRDHGIEAGLEAQRGHTVGRPRRSPAEEARAEERFRSLDPAGVVGEARALMTAMPLHAFLRGIDVPVLVVHGEDDDVWPPPDQALLARTAARARRVVIADSAHAAQSDSPGPWGEAVAGFLREADRARDAARQRAR